MMISDVSFQKQVMLCFVGLQQGHGWAEGLTRHRARQDARPFFPLPVSPSPSPAQRFCRRRVGTGVEGGARARGGLLTDGTGVRRLSQVLGHLPVDVKPAESRGDGDCYTPCARCFIYAIISFETCNRIRQDAHAPFHKWQNRVVK